MSRCSRDLDSADDVECCVAIRVRASWRERLQRLIICISSSQPLFSASHSFVLYDVGRISEFFSVFSGTARRLRAESQPQTHASSEDQVLLFVHHRNMRGSEWWATYWVGDDPRSRACATLSRRRLRSRALVAGKGRCQKA